MSRRLALVLSGLGLVVLAVPISAQQIVDSGRALDANLRLGSGGYNSVGAVGGGHARFHRPTRPEMVGRGNAFRDPVYRTRPAGIDYYNAFQRERMYGADRAMTTFGNQVRVGGGHVPSREISTSRYASAYDAGYNSAMMDAAQTEMPVEATHQMEMISYGVGYFLGEKVLEAIRRDGVEVDLESLIAGFRDGLHGSQPQVSREEIEEIMAQVHKMIRARMADELLAVDPEFKKQHDENLAKSRAFHEAYGQVEGVVTLRNRLQYKVLEEGTGRSPGLDDTVVITYTVMDLDGSVITRAEAETVEINDMTEGGALLLQMMRQGAKWEAAIPPELAHGPAGNYPTFGPNETIFGIVELIEIKE